LLGLLSYGETTSDNVTFAADGNRIQTIQDVYFRTGIFVRFAPTVGFGILAGRRVRI
jgi:hypothetical protein